VQLKYSINQLSGNTTVVVASLQTCTR